MAREAGKKQDRWWLVDMLFNVGELLLFIPKWIFRIFSDVN